MSDYLPPPEALPTTRASKPKAPALPIPPPSFSGESTPEMIEKAQLFERAMAAFQQRGYLVHPERPDRAEQLKKLEKIFEVFGKNGFSVLRLQAALKWEVRHMEKAQKRGVADSDTEELEQSAVRVRLEDSESSERAGEEQSEGPVFHTRAERKALKKAREEAALVQSRSSDLESPQTTGEKVGESNQAPKASTSQKRVPLDIAGGGESTVQNESQVSEQLGEPVGDESGHASAAESTIETIDDAAGQETKGEWKRTVRKKRRSPEELPPGSPYAGSLKGLVKGVGEGGPFTEFVRGPTQPAHRGGQGPGLTLRQKRLSAQIQKALAEVMMADGDLRSSLLEEGGFAVLEVRLTHELDTAFVRWTCNQGAEKEVEKKLGRVAGRLRTALFKALAMPFSPRLEFKYDELSEQIHAIEDAFDRLHDL
ncbi:hypothetical protein KFL_003250050 [Klebsormidium nitens]|uniref:Ribosome-binding factor A n=1 Tax=Klebsormidium nitens TaxID=105231 RepID=A0A1Y1IAM0_KLENI|nr:hypothetical protein KFL_003250050 [Klebsormidium nitens]|eukprot:GAQ87002.1 hypothetical protein KFL_003250050 [Klebsormidium nitens]